LIKIHKKNKKTYIYLSSVIFVIGVFILGINIGNGNIAIVKKSTISSNLPQNLDYSSVNQLYKLIKENYDGSLNNQQVLDGLKTGLAQSTNDPYTEYFSANQAKIFNSEISGTFSGIGAQMGNNSQGQLIVVSPITGFPAYNSGVKAGDIITSINGKSTANLNVDAAVNLIRGPQGSYVKLDVIRGSSQLSFKIKRDEDSL
jgi:carboxyl-terminal processing protease